MSTPVPDGWPRVPVSGRLLCTSERPMPKGAHGLWSHAVARVVGQCEHKCCDLVLCQDCGASWKLPRD